MLLCWVPICTTFLAVNAFLSEVGRHLVIYFMTCRHGGSLSIHRKENCTPCVIFIQGSSAELLLCVPYCTNWYANAVYEIEMRQAESRWPHLNVASALVSCTWPWDGLDLQTADKVAM